MLSGGTLMNKRRAFCCNRNLLLYTLGVACFITAALFSIGYGSSSLSLLDWNLLLEKGVLTPQGQILGYVRIPRTLAPLFCGAALSVSGAVIQKVLQNPLASPGVLGVNAGAGCAVTLSCVLGIWGGWQLSLFAFLGAWGSILLVTALANTLKASRSTVILLGVALNSFFGAATGALTTLFPDSLPMGNDFKVGGFSSVAYHTLLPAMGLIILALVILFSLKNQMEVLSLGEETARSLGQNTKGIRTLLLTLCGILIGCSVALSGLLSFVGLLIPHALRRFVPHKTGHHLVLCALFGGAFVCFCDTLARVLFAPYELPVGIFLAFLGAPFFVFLLIKGKGGHKS